MSTVHEAEKERILLVEDETAMRMHCKMLLRLKDTVS